MKCIRKLAVSLLLFTAFTVSVNAQTCPPNTGCLDPSFNGTGKVFIPTATRSHNASGTIQSDGKIVWLGDNSTDGTTLVRLNTDGSLDTTFGTGGIVYTNWHFNTTIPRGYPYDIAIQNIDGEERFVVVGVWTIPSGKKSSKLVLRMDRYLSTGAPDASFGTNGTLLIDNPVALAVDVDYAGRIVAVGDAGAVTRRLADGSIDTTFGPDGAGVTGAGGYMKDVKALADGSLLFAGSCASGRDNYMCVTKLKENGAVEETFGTEGRAFANFYGSGSYGRAFGLDIDASGNIVAAGQARAASTRNSTPLSYFAAARFTPTGSLDTSFNGNGKVISSIEGIAKSVHWLPNGGIVMTATKGGPSIVDFALTSYTSTGLLDLNFGNSGLIFTDVSAQDWTQKSILWTDPSCFCTKLVVFGGSDGGSYGVSFARYVLD